MFVRGEGCFVYDEQGKEYLDCLAGIAVNGLGHCPPKVVEAICKQAGDADAYVATSIIPRLQPKLAKLLVEASGMDKAFFCNSGAEANEAAIKLARKATKVAGHPEKTEIITALRVVPRADPRGDHGDRPAEVSEGVHASSRPISSMCPIMMSMR